MTAPRHIALIPAAGVGARLGGPLPKQYRLLGTQPMLQYVLATFAAASLVSDIFVLVSEDDALIAPLLASSGFAAGRIQVLRCGGPTRQQTVLNALDALAARVDESDWILVHDAARPGLRVAMIDTLIAAVGTDPVGGLLALPVADTLKRGSGGRSTQTLERDGLWAAQTPQMFRYALLRRALRSATEVTDEASAIEALGLQPKLVPGNLRNFKVTLPEDIQLATDLLRGQQ